MAISIQSIQDLQDYLQGVLGRAGHHAQNVEGVSLALMGAVIWRADGPIDVREYAGRPANMLWFNVGNNRYVLTYDHPTNQIHLKDRSNTGAVLHRFDNASTYMDVMNAFSGL